MVYWLRSNSPPYRFSGIFSSSSENVPGRILMVLTFSGSEYLFIIHCCKLSSSFFNFHSLTVLNDLSSFSRILHFVSKVSEVAHLKNFLISCSEIISGRYSNPSLMSVPLISRERRLLMFWKDFKEPLNLLHLAPPPFFTSFPISKKLILLNSLKTSMFTGSVNSPFLMEML
ncbi:MAG: hypothetical protein MRERC_9c058 [Mycoplasmataceae bacterium RC_NB112A]|nr:MAG: hypothetical protein MRERC_9c058 [Mycoplasmataceae bacterium RC_NB112A]